MAAFAQELAGKLVSRDDARIGRGHCSAPARRWPICEPTARLPISVGAIPFSPDLRRDGGVPAVPADQLL
jgi:hypothetical protein